ncbi:alpha/beta hydrolase [Vineibacter terrae]|uniref:Alpha/beta hydrolase n=1 Tax=Vineibacter terrae TaxID=2586908 RepID=A0A5C8PR48_9HYPH|nr:alpha/beta hydrolase [Vineibacter terrae]TXL77687.1 alpha/beta hydrolase [Vineibacter terrae]
MDRRRSGVPAMALTLSALMTAGSAAAQTSPLPPQLPAAYVEAIRSPLRHPLREAGVVRSRQTAGARADGTPLMVDLTLPRQEAGKPVPVVVLVHGGLSDEAPIKPSAWQVYRDWGAVLAASGVAAVMFDHTLGVPRRRLDQAMGEVDAVLAWLAKEGASRGLDLQRVRAFVFSAGGLLVPELLSDGRPVRIDSVAMFYPSTGIVPGSPSAAVVDAAVGERMSLRAAAARLAKRGTPLLMLRAGKDEIPGLLAMLDETTTALLAADAPVEVVNLPAAPHSFDYRLDRPDVRAGIDRALALAGRP